MRGLAVGCSQGNSTPQTEYARVPWPFRPRRGRKRRSRNPLSRKNDLQVAGLRYYTPELGSWPGGSVLRFAFMFGIWVNVNAADLVRKPRHFRRLWPLAESPVTRTATDCFPAFSRRSTSIASHMCASLARAHSGCDRDENLRGSRMLDGDADHRLERTRRQRRFQPDMNPLRLVRVFVPLSGVRRPESASHTFWTGFVGFGRHGSPGVSPSMVCGARDSEGTARRESRPPWFVVHGIRRPWAQPPHSRHSACRQVALQSRSVPQYPCHSP